MDRALVLYIPVLHAGHIRLFEKYRRSARTLFLLGPDLIKELMPLHEEIRALSPDAIKAMAETLGIFNEVKILTRKNAAAELKAFALIAGGNQTTQNFIKKYAPRANASIDSAFLRWDEKNVQTATAAASSKGATISPFDKKIVKKLAGLSEASSDWWRQVGAVIAKGSNVLIEAHNRHVPSEHMPYIDGDPRDVIPAGKDPGLSTAVHAEQGAIAEAARRGIKLEGTSIYVSAFPCPVCAKLIAYSGIKKCFYVKGSATLDGERVFRAKGVEIIRL